jgi:ribonucleoside-diphosphate reductase alpha chain
VKISRRYTIENQDPYAGLEIKKWDVRIGEGDKVVFAMNGILAPSTWSQNAVNVLSQKYFRKTDVPNFVEPIEKYSDVPDLPVASSPLPVWLRNKKPTSDAKFGSEYDFRQVFDRLAGCWTWWGWSSGLFDVESTNGKKVADESSARAFYDEVRYMLAHQMAAPNSPQFFNTGLFWAYGLKGQESGHHYVNADGKLLKAGNAYVRPQSSACFIQSVSDDLVREGGIMDLWMREALLFKYGSGTGSNFSKLRGDSEPLSGGGVSSGLLSWISTIRRFRGSSIGR